MAWLALAWAARLPAPLPRPDAAALASTHTDLARAIAPSAAAHPGLSGVAALADGHLAFAVRLQLVDAAQSSLDLQYYIWRNDSSGRMLLDAIRAAADRGVRVRLLLDDNNTGGLDALLAALDAHALVEVRLANPFALRGARWAGWLTQFPRLNRRMHNKVFLVDGQVAVLGGRNIGDEYFDVPGEMVFADLDLAVVGAVVPDLAADFDRYWNHPMAWPAGELLEPARADALESLAAEVVGERDRRDGPAYTGDAAGPLWIAQLLSGALAWEWAATRMVSDNPDKITGTVERDGLMAAELVEAMGTPRHSLDVVSPYLVPGARGADLFVELAGRGVAVRLLTNALEATDVAAVHAGWARHRVRLLKAGVAVHELKRQMPGHLRLRMPWRGSSDSSLHAKTFGVDGERVFVGSFNFDPRSVHLNTEMGVVVESPYLAGLLDQRLQRVGPALAYTLSLDDDALVWTEIDGEQVKQHRVEPGTTRMQRAVVGLLAMLPIEWLL